MIIKKKISKNKSQTICFKYANLNVSAFPHFSNKRFTVHLGQSGLQKGKKKNYIYTQVYLLANRRINNDYEETREKDFNVK